MGTRVQITYCHDTEPTVASLWETPRTIYGIEEDGWIPKMLSNRLIVTRDGEWMLPFWRENAMLAKELWPDAQVLGPVASRRLCWGSQRLAFFFFLFERID